MKKQRIPTCSETLREQLRMKLFIDAYVRSMHLTKVDEEAEAAKAVRAFDAQFPKR